MQALSWTKKIMAAIAVFVVIVGGSAALLRSGGMTFAAVPASELIVSSYVWNSVLGWTALRGSIEATPGQTAGTYGIVIRECTQAEVDASKCTATDRDQKNGIVTGFAWSPRYGWICFGDTCDFNKNPALNDEAKYGLLAPPSGWTTRVKNLYVDGAGVSGSLLDCDGGGQTVCYRVQGFAKILSLKDNGWIKLDDTVDDTHAPQDEYGVTYNSSSRFFEGWAWSGHQVDAIADNLGWFVFSGKSIATTPGACTTNCGVSYDSEEGSLWTAQVIDRWLQTLGGNLYAQKGFKDNKEPPRLDDAYNSTGLLQVSGSAVIDDGWRRKCASIYTNAVGLGARCGVDDADSTGASAILRDAGLLLVPDRGNGYATAIGQLPVTALTNTVAVKSATPAGRAINAYGYKFVEVSSGDDLIAELSNGSANSDDSVPEAGGTIYVYKSDGVPLRIGATNLDKFNFDGQQGGVTVVAEGGDIIFDRAMEYRSSPDGTSNQQIPSVAWVALTNTNNNGGNIRISDCVLPADGTIGPVEVVGTMIAEVAVYTGTGEKSRTQSCDGLTAGVTSKEEIAITLRGKVVAPQVVLQRMALPANTGSEQIIDDGRFMRNPPPGLEAFAKQLPVWRNISP